ncbi:MULTISPECIES: hypothetical protein [unclassified Streptomyces]|uniref:hypothetical protein n=1 Tax=unclassified Streptomyces TaxID=2593676 RepID=UPI0038180D55
MIVKMLHEKGLTSEHAYCAGFLSVGLAVASWFGSMKVEPLRLARADRWGIFVGEWAPTFFAIGLALANYERESDLDFDQEPLLNAEPPEP